MIEEINVLGVFMPAALLWAVAALVMTSLCGRLLRRVPLRSLVLRPALIDLAIFFLTWWGIASLADASFSHGIIS
jgi:protein AaeX